MSPYLRSSVSAIEQWHPRVKLAVAIGTTAILGVADYLTGVEISFSVFYLIPVLFATWFMGRNWGLILTVMSAIEWHLANQAATVAYSHPLIPYWNSFTRILIQGVIVLLMAQVLKDLEMQKSLADTDFLTGALSKRAFYRRVETELLRKKRKQTPLTLVFLDADNFKAVNDTGGHDEGDRLLISCTHTITTALRASDAVGRLGGDEFAVLLPDTPAEPAEQVARKVQGLLDLQMREHRWPVTFSIGVLCCERMPESIAQMVKMADELMYRAKRSGKNAVSVQVY